MIKTRLNKQHDYGMGAEGRSAEVGIFPASTESHWRRLDWRSSRFRCNKTCESCTTPVLGQRKTARPGAEDGRLDDRRQAARR